MTTTSASREQIIASLRNKGYRDALVEEGIDEGIPFQIRAMRQARGWSQKELARRLGMTQHGVSRLENPNYGKFTLATLKRLAPVFDVALVVKYVPFSQFADWMANLSPDDLAVPDYEHDPGLAPPSQRATSTLAAAESPPVTQEMVLRDVPLNRVQTLRLVRTPKPPATADHIWTREDSVAPLLSALGGTGAGTHLARSG